MKQVKKYFTRSVAREIRLFLWESAFLIVISILGGLLIVSSLRW